MSSNTLPNRDIRTQGYVLRRTNYGEADRILNIITPNGKMSVIAKSVRKPKSKLAGAIEIFTLSEYNIHVGKSELGTLTGAKMLKHYGQIVKDFARMELAAEILKKVNKMAESSDSPDFFKLVDSGLGALNNGDDVRLVEAWFLLNLVRASGEEINLYRDIDGELLKAEQKYTWDRYELVFVCDDRGIYGADEIKLLRLMCTTDLGVVLRVKTNESVIANVLFVAQSIGKTRL